MIWEYVDGRNSEGDAISYWQLFDSTGRVLACIDVPQNDERQYHCDFKIWPSQDRDYLDIVHAKRYCEEQVLKALAKERKRTRRRKTR